MTTTTRPLHHNGHDAQEAIRLLNANENVSSAWVALQEAMEEALTPLVQTIVAREDDALVAFEARHPDADLHLLVLKGFNYYADNHASGLLDYALDCCEDDNCDED